MKQVKKNLPAEQRRAVTVEAVIQLAAEKNPSTITTAEIAARMNLTQGALFRHFPKKDALWQSVMEWISVRLLGDVDEVIGKANSPMEALELMFLAHINFAARHPGAPRMMFAELQRPDKSAAKRVAHAMLSKYSERLEKIFEHAMAEGVIDTNLDVSTASVMFIGLVQGLVMQSLIAGDTSVMLSNAKPVFALYCQAIKKSER
ncbi:MAG: TetR/AcrR family transcriptional regulator [Chlorobiales bacterium]|nr:TetR/AcrR family transcriptional regulator [Chlorobiales bacterium]